MNQIKINRINELARKSREEQGLTSEEKLEQQCLRREYIDNCKKNLESQLKNISVLKKQTGDI